jgi:hypothetical protein
VSLRPAGGWSNAVRQLGRLDELGAVEVRRREDVTLQEARQMGQPIHALFAMKIYSRRALNTLTAGLSGALHRLYAGADAAMTPKGDSVNKR